MKTATYHLALMLHKKKNGHYNAQFQAETDKDCLSCEVFSYRGYAQMTKYRMIQTLKGFNGAILESLRGEFPKKQIDKLLVTLY